MSKARSMVNVEVKAGRMPRVHTLKCTDCNNTAQCYDHRDYLKPLYVQPVCRRCNKKRGPGKNKDLLYNTLR